MQLSSVLRANAASCLIFGLGFAIFPASIAAFLGSAPGFLIQILGVGLVINAALLWMASLRGAKRADVLFFSLSDPWVAATVMCYFSAACVEWTLSLMRMRVAVEVLTSPWPVGGSG